ncbi:glycosyltransferase family 2 protein [Sinanaerobacter chloroacetimidivorans]|uniref:Glycosyltransferase family 2 protein n=1 Tax=Sinanaerobacter chloroacetimidivorans TaxID=2818044 RepID=A0A8J7W3W5_9FIRM|nr:glycosyltransferase family 2 protein [Sinanaerobacter chloroacetimidivorans]MBR0598460.1 glycosyltransferase family 2 protein [Sinanaerobacter chloroacetimidivorans]
MENKKLSIIVSVYNEQEVLRHFHSEMTKVLDGMNVDHELIYVNDGSSDFSQSILADLAKDQPTVKVINFSRNFGHEAAMVAGIDNSTGDFVVCIDADLEKPPAEVIRMYQAYLDGNEVVNMVYSNNKIRGAVRQYMTKLYYKFLNKISRIQFVESSSDFFGISRTVADILKESYRERKRYIRGFIQSMGFRSISLEYIPNERYAGTSKYNFKALLNLAIVAITNFSDKPLRLGFYLAAFCFFLAGIAGMITIKDLIIGNGAMILDFAMLMFLFIFSLMFFFLGILGIYLGDIQQECKGNPIYHIKDTYNF